MDHPDNQPLTQAAFIVVFGELETWQKTRAVEKEPSSKGFIKSYSVAQSYSPQAGFYQISSLRLVVGLA